MSYIAVAAVTPPTGASTQALLDAQTLTTQVDAVVTMDNVTGGLEDAGATVQLNNLDGVNITSERIVLLLVTTAQYGWHGATLSTTCTFLNPTGGTIVDSGTGWCLYETDAGGGGTLDVNNTADETAYLVAVTADGVGDLAKACTVIGCIPNSAAWSA